MGTRTADPRPDGATGRDWLALAVLGLPTLLVSLDIGALFMALPQLAAELNTTTVEQLWITDAYGFLLAGLLIPMGALGDRIGRRRLLLVGAGAFGILSVVAAMSTTPEMLIAARALLGVAGATLMPSTLALITNVFTHPAQRRTAIAAWVSTMMAGAAVGPVVGGVLLERFYWGSVFLLGVPIMVVLLAVGPFLLPETRTRTTARIDPVDVVLSFVAILATVYGVKELAAGHTAHPVVAAAATVAGILTGIVFIRRQIRSASPLLDLRLFHNRSLRAVVTAMALCAAAMAGSFLLVSQYVQSVLGFTPAESGLLLLPTGLAVAIGAQVGPRLATRWGAQPVMTGGLLFGALGFGALFLTSESGSPALAVAGIAAAHLGAGPLFALGSETIMSATTPERSGSAAALSETANNLGSTLGLAFLGTLGGAVYQRGMSDVPVADAARETVGGAVSVAEGLSARGGEALLATADAAFVDGIHAAAVLSTLIFLAMAGAIARATTRRDGSVRPAAEQTSVDTPTHAPTGAALTQEVYR